MSEQKKVRDKNYPTRREFLKHGVLLGAAAGGFTAWPGLVARSFAAQRNHILIGHPSPRTGPLAIFGQVSPWADDRITRSVNKAGGIYIKEAGKKLPILIKTVDTQSDPGKASQIAEDLIQKDKVDMMVVMHTPATVNPVSKVCESHSMPCVSADTPLEPWLSDGPYNWCFHTFWSVNSLSDLFLGIWGEYADQTSKVFGALWPNDPDGHIWANIFSKKLIAQGYKIVDPGRFHFITPDFTEMIDLFKREKVEIIGGVPIPPDWANFWRQARQDGLHPKMVAVSKATEFPSSVNALEANLPDGLISEIWWSPYHPFKSSLNGESAKDLCNAWETENKRQWTMPLGFVYAGLEIAIDALKRAGTLRAEPLRKAIETTNLNTVVGRIKYDEKHVCETPLVAGQWTKGKKWPWELTVSYNKMLPQVATTAPMRFPLPIG
jgi:branched-chain amino acid transport system substrate-binding protein